MTEENRYDRYGLGENPLVELSANRLVRISRSHANLSVDDRIGDIKSEVFHRKKKAFITIYGREGFGKSERILVAKKEAETNKLFHGMFLAKPGMKSAMYGLLDSLSEKGSTLFSNDKWEREIANAKKKVKKGYDPNFVGSVIAKALNANIPSFLLIDDIHYVLRAPDCQSFFQALAVAMSQSLPGVFFLITVDEGFAIPKPIVNLIQNIQTDLFHLDKISTDEAKFILSKQLESYRLVSGISSTFPFTLDAVEKLNKTARGNPLLFLSCANVALTAAAMQKTISITKEVVEDSLNIIKNQSFYHDLSSLVLDRKVQLRMLLPINDIKKIDQYGPTEHSSDFQDGSLDSDLINADSLDGNDLKKPVPSGETDFDDTNIDSFQEEQKGEDQLLSHKSSDTSANEVNSENIDQSISLSNESEDHSDRWKPVVNSNNNDEELKSSKKTDNKVKSDFSNEQEQSKESKDKKETVEPKKKEKIKENTNFIEPSESKISKSISSDHYSYQPEVGLVDIHPTSMSNLNLRDHNNNHSIHDDIEHKKNSVESKDTIDSDMNKEDDVQLEVSKMKNENVSDVQSIQKESIDQATENKDSVNVVGPNNSLHKKQVREESDDDIRIVKAKCPECDKIFSTEISKNKKELLCPYCGFTGGY